MTMIIEMHNIVWLLMRFDIEVNNDDIIVWSDYKFEFTVESSLLLRVSHLEIQTMLRMRRNYHRHVKNAALNMVRQMLVEEYTR